MHQQVYSVALLCLLFTLSCGLDVTFNLMEEKSAGTLVGNILSKSGILSTLENVDRQSLRCDFLEQQSPMKTLFSINTKTSDLFTTVVIDREDRENICNFQPVCQLEFDISVRSSTQTQFFQRITVIIKIEDKNDNNPIFPEPKVVLKITEAAEIGTEHRLNSAIDPDYGTNGIQSYEIKPQGGAFNLTTYKNIDDSYTIKIVVNADLDREVQDHYQVTVIATDGGEPKKEGIVIVDIEVTDVNDNPPIFAKETYQVNVKEDFPLDEPILEVSATDKDIGVNGELFYKFSSQQINYGIFSINETSGAIMLKRSLVYKPELTYRFVVEVSDRSDAPQTDQALVILNVLDAGNNPPTVKVNVFNPQPGNMHDADISESAPIGEHVAHVDVQDTDTGDNGIVDCETTSPFSLKKLGDGEGYMVIVSEALDRENKDTHNVTTICQDHGNPPLSSSVSFYIHVTDTNDEAPTFANQHYIANVVENSSPSNSLLTVSAFDKDLGVNAEIRYQLHEDANSKFLIDSDSGEITTNGVFDRETTPNVVFRILAIDSGISPQTGTATITVNIGDINDNVPVFDKSTLKLEIDENKKANSVVGTVSASDSDAEENATVEYALFPGQNLDFPFEILSDGTVKTNRELDREKQSRYDFQIVARDQGSVVSLSSSAWVTVTVRDINDNSPIIRWPNATHNILQITSIITNQPIAQVSAYDVDDNQDLSYTIQGGNQDGAFLLNKQSGELFIAEGYETGKDQDFRLSIAVKDSDENPLYSQHYLKVIIRGSNETATAETLEVSKKYIIISAVVVTVTVLISIGLIAVICIVRRVDKKKQNQYVSNTADMSIMQNYDKHLSHRGSQDSNRSKKGVSFSLDNEDKQIPLSKYSVDMKNKKVSICVNCDCIFLCQFQEMYNCCPGIFFAVNETD